MLDLQKYKEDVTRQLGDARLRLQEAEAQIKRYSEEKAQIDRQVSALIGALQLLERQEADQKVEQQKESAK